MKRRREFYRLTAEPIGPQLEASLKPVLNARGFAGSGLLLAWQQVVPAELKSETRPTKLTKPRSAQVSGGKRVLEVRCSEGAHILLTYQKSRLIQSLNQKLGRGAIDDIRFVKEAQREPKVGPLPEPETERIARKRSPSLDSALERLHQIRLSRKGG